MACSDTYNEDQETCSICIPGSTAAFATSLIPAEINFHYFSTCLSWLKLNSNYIEEIKVVSNDNYYSDQDYDIQLICIIMKKYISE